jgi:hypothetical protein
MSETEHLRQVIAAQIAPLAQRRQWTEVQSEQSSRASLRDYVAGNLYFRISSDRGLIEIEIGSCADDLLAVSFYKDLLSPPSLGHWNLSVEQACGFIDEEWDWLMEHLSREQAPSTVQRVDANARRKG